MIAGIYEDSEEIQEGSPTNNIVVGNCRLRRAERWENIPRVFSEVGEIYVVHIYYKYVCIPGAAVVVRRMGRRVDTIIGRRYSSRRYRRSVGGTAVGGTGDYR